MVNKIRQNNLCPAQEAFTTCVKSWLESPETLILDVSSVHVTQRELIEKAMADQDRIGWHLAMRGYLSKYWKRAVSANWFLEENEVLHNTALESSRKMRDADINDAITKLYEKKDTYAAEDRWYFEKLPLVLRLRKPLRSRRRWLVNARILANKSEHRATIGQTMLIQYYQHLPSVRTTVSRTRMRIVSARQYIQTSLLNLWNPNLDSG
jgi:hypothetical protein